jgi:hypothetical protein
MLSSPEDRKTLLNAIKELSNSMTRVESERDFQKDAITDCAERLDLEKKYVRKLASIYHKQNFAEVQADQEEVEALYSLITESNNEQKAE